MATKGNSYFIDHGRELPFFLKSWYHKHNINFLDGNTTEIHDEVQLEMGPLSVLLFFPGVILQFLYRKPLYKSYFKGLMAKA